jgi:hypothetical protein
MPESQSPGPEQAVNSKTRKHSPNTSQATHKETKHSPPGSQTRSSTSKHSASKSSASKTSGEPSSVIVANGKAAKRQLTLPGESAPVSKRRKSSLMKTPAKVHGDGGDANVDGIAASGCVSFNSSLLFSHHTFEEMICFFPTAFEYLFYNWL